MPARPTSAILGALPPQWPEDLAPAIRAEVRDSGAKLAVLDDDPTGTQTVHGVPVLTGWETAQLRAELLDPSPVFYILTNSRSLGGPEARALVRGIARNLTDASRAAGRPVRILSRGDSTLRGHFPEETDGIAEGTGVPPGALLLAPFFREGGRYTVGDVHWVEDGDSLVPAAETEFARDPVLGYRASNLREWVEEKTAGRIPASAVRSLSIGEIRAGGPGPVCDRLTAAPSGTVWIVNAAARRDLEVVALGLLRAERAGLRALCRTAASFVPACCGIPEASLLASASFEESSAGGLIVVGSFVPRTTRQLQALLAAGEARPLELKVRDLLDPGARGRVVAASARFASAAIRHGSDAVLYTSRALASGSTPAESAAIHRAVSSALSDMLARIDVRPRFLLAKGGITASDLATGALGVRRALVMGQVHPGVPVWKLGPESRFPDLPYIVFPGNVGGPDALAETVARMRGRIPAAEAAR